MNKLYTVLVLIMIACSSIHAQTPAKTDSVIINVGEKSKVIFAIGDKADLQTLKQYNFQQIVDDLVAKLEKQDSSNLAKPADDYLKNDQAPTQDNATQPDNSTSFNDDWNRSWDDRDNRDDSYSRSSDRRDREYTRRYYGRRTHHSFNFDFGTNNFLGSGGNFPNQNNEIYSVRPWGSWYVGINSIQRSRLARKFFLEWGVGVSWYNFKFENDKVRISKDDNSVIFSEDQRDVNFIKSKLTATFLNTQLIPVIDFGGRGRRGNIFDGDHDGAFRIGLGPYAGYRIGSYSKLVYKEDGDRKREKDHDSFYLNNVRYGLRLQVGFRSTDLFLSYDLNDMFASNKGPKLNAFTFGLTF